MPVANSHSLDLESGSSQYASVADTVPLSLTGDMSMFAWVRLESDTGSEQCITSKFNGDTGNRSYIFAVSPTILKFYNSSTGANLGSCEVATTINTATFYHVGFTKAGTVVKFYQNGAQVSTDQTAGFEATFNGNAAFALGANGVGATPERYFDGLMDEVVVTSDVLTPSEISDLYAGWDASLMLDNKAGCWKLNNDFTDSSGNGATLTGSGSPTFSTTVPFANYAEASSGGGNPMFFSSGGLALG